MKRPIGIYLVAVWFYLGIHGFFTGPIFTVVLKNYFSYPGDERIFGALSGVFLVFMIVGLIRLNKIVIWGAITIFALFGLYQIYAFIGFLIVSPSESKMILIKGVLGFPSIICAVYLLTPSFRKRANEFVVLRKQKKEQQVKL